MSKFVRLDQIVEIVLGDGDHVWVRERLTAAEQAELERSLVHIRLDTRTGQMVSEEGDWHLNRLAIVKAHVVKWDFKDDEGQLVPYSPSLVESLDADTVNEIARAIDQMQAARREQTAKNG